MREEFPLRARDGEGFLFPLLPLDLYHKTARIHVVALVDSGSAVNVLPHKNGLDLGLVWEEQTTPVSLSGVLQDAEARAVLLPAKIGSFPVVQQVFAWTKAEIPLILGHVNFFDAFDFSLRRSSRTFSLSTSTQ